MKLQLALDTLDLEQSLRLLDSLADQLDIIEVGTPFIIKAGLKPVTVIKKRYPACLVLADVKIMDGGEYEAASCFAAGADIVTVLAVSHDQTIAGTLRAAKKYRGQIMVDMIACGQLEKRIQEIDEMGVDYIGVHTAFDLQDTGADPLAELKVLNSLLKKAKSAVAGGLKVGTLGPVIAAGAEIIVVGGGITGADDPRAATLAIKNLMKER